MSFLSKVTADQNSNLLKIFATSNNRISDQLVLIMNSVFKNLLSNLTVTTFRRQNVSFRNYATIKRFYKNTNVLYSDGKYEITLDHRKLKTPNGSPFAVKSEPLAIAIAAEWNSQKEKIDRSTMHLTALCSTVIDNPNKLEKVDMINYMLNFLESDTILFQSDQEEDLYKLQAKEWDPVIEWFNERYQTNIKKTLDMNLPQVTPDDKMNVAKYLTSHNTEALHGFFFAIDTLKSIMLAFAAIDQHLSIERAVHLARLEEEYQLGFWGRVEWAHDLNQQDLQARLAAAVLFVHFNRNETIIKEKVVV